MQHAHCVNALRKRDNGDNITITPTFPLDESLLLAYGFHVNFLLYPFAADKIGITVRG